MKHWIWPFALLGVGAALLLAVLDAPAWAYALSMVCWCTAGAMWLQRDGGQADPGVAHAVHAPAGGVAVAPAAISANWQDWISGWYWETDGDQHLTVFKPGFDAVNGLHVDWPELSEYIESHPGLSTLWPGADGDASAAGRLAYCLQRQLAWREPLVLPWPSALRGLAAPSEGWRCALLGEPRLDAEGRFLGHRGVWQVLAPPLPCSSSLSPADPAGPGKAAEAEGAVQEQMSEAEQEVLRYALSHDLRAPLRVVEGFTKIVKEDYGHALDRLGNDHLERVLTAAARMNGMIDAILAQAQLAAEPLQRVAIDLSALAREVGEEQVAALAGSVKQDEAGVPAVLNVAEGLRIEADPLLVRRVLDNLIGNALKYSAKVAAPQVEVGVMPATNPCVFYVRDNGAGFDMQHADKLFGMFQRLHSAKEFPGTGVGLAGVQNIVRRHGGRIWAEARQGEGACFYFTLMGTVEAQQRAAARASQ